MPVVTDVGVGLGPTTSVDVGAAGGTVTSPDGRLTVRIPAGAVATTTTITVQRISAEAPGAVVAYRLGPEGATFDVPVELVVAYVEDDVRGSAPEALEIGFQNPDGIWSVLRQFTLDATANTLTATTTHFSDWSLLLGLQLRPAAPVVMIGERVDLVVNDCRLVDVGSELVQLLAECEPEALLLRTADWSVNGILGGNSTVGVVAGKEVGTGTFDAPSSKPMPSRVAVSTVFTSASRNGLKGLLVANVAIVDVKGWSGSMNYIASGSQISDDTMLAGTTTTQTHIVNQVTGAGAMYFEPSFIPSSMSVNAGNGSWTQSTEKTVVATDTQPVCPQVHTVIDDEQVSGGATDPADPLAFVYLSVTGDTYQLRLSTLAGIAIGTHRLAESGALVAGGTGTNCVVPPGTDATVESTRDFPMHELLLEGTLDDPNTISGQKTFIFEPVLPTDAAHTVNVTWRFEK